MSLKEELSEHFWNISCQFYASQGVKGCLLDLQEQQHKVVNQLLFSLWVSTYFDYRFYNKDTIEILRLTRLSHFNVRIVRYLRKKVGKNNPILNGFFTSLRRILLRVELLYEKKHQKQLVVSWLKVAPFMNDKENKSTFELPVRIDKDQHYHNLRILNGDTENSNDYVYLLSKWLSFIHH